MTTPLTLFISRRPSTLCTNCRKEILLGEPIYCEHEKQKGLCFNCSPAHSLQFLPSGDTALTRRSAKLSSVAIVLKQWNQRRKRYERRGQYVTTSALEEAQKWCAADTLKREEQRKKAALKRQKEDAQYHQDFAQAIRALFPSCPPQREFLIATHACEKHSGRVGRTAQAKEFDSAMITRAVIAHIRHSETNYDTQFGKGKRKQEIREDIRGDIEAILNRWQRPTV